MNEQHFPVVVPKLKALMLLFEGFNTLDVNGPYETFTRASRSTIFTLTVASESEVTKSSEGVRMVRDISLQDALSQLAEYDILIVPGGPTGTFQNPGPVLTQIDAHGGFMSIIQKFASLAPNKKMSELLLPQGGPQQSAPHEMLVVPRVLLCVYPSLPEAACMCDIALTGFTQRSICTGALFLSKLGILNEVNYCTTHWSAYEMLKTINAQAATDSGLSRPPSKVLPARFVDGGKNRADVHIISAGGVSCGIDASLHVVKMVTRQKEAADAMNGVVHDESLLTANGMDYAWKKTDGVNFDDSEWWASDSFKWTRAQS